MISCLPFRWIPGLLGVLALLIFACQLTGDDKVEHTLSFTKQFDSLAQYDSVLIVLKDTTGRTLDIVYRGKVDTIGEIEGLKAPHWNGGIVVVSITGFKGGEIVYAVNTKFNGATDKKIDSSQVILPGTALSVEALEIRLTEGDSVPLPAVTVTPVALSDKTLYWISSAPQILYVGTGYLKALARGSARLTATLKSNPTKTLNLDVTVSADPTQPDSLILSPDTLFLAAGGASEKLAVRIVPVTANPGVTWILRDTAVAGFIGEGLLQGLRQGETRAVAVSRRKPAIIDSCVITVSGPVAVEKVQFQKDSVDLFLKGTAESLIVVVLPPKANPKVEFEILDDTKVSLINGKIIGVAEGSTRVIAHSSENPAKADTLKVTVFPTQLIDSVRVNQDTLNLFTGGQSTILTGKVYPATAIQFVQWRSQNISIASVDANGKISPLAPGKTLVFAQSRVDSSKQDTVIVIVKKDMPQVFAGRDSVVSLGATVVFRPQVTQEYGSVIQFKWDLNGDGAWDGSSDSLKSVSYTFDQPEEYSLGFYVKDSEGNDTTVFRKIKVVNGLAVQILSPLDNTYTKEFGIAVSWTVDGKAQESLTSQTLKLGSNIITRSAKDGAGNLFSASVTVFVDTTPPLKPIVKGPSRTASKTPTWTWSTGGGGGSGNYKYWLDVDDAALGKETRDTLFTPATELSEALHTLFVSERDAAGNWSPAGRFSLYVDVSGPDAPKVSISPASPTNVRKPKWTWSPGGNGGVGAYQFRLDNSSLTTGATPTTDTSFTPSADLAHGTHTLYVQEKDSAGNWSASGSAAVVIDTIVPDAPNVTSTVTSPTNNTLPTWNWTSGGNGGRGFYRYKVGDTLWATGALQGTATTFTPTSALAEGVRTLYVEEQDSAGNWSSPGLSTLTIDVTPPAAPKMDSTPYSPLNSLKPVWTWKAGGGGNGTYRCRVDNPDLSAGAMNVTQPSFAQGSDLPEGVHTLYVQERDLAGNWSAAASRTLVLSVRAAVGTSGFSMGSAYMLSLAFNRDGVPYVAYKDGANSLKASVMRFNSGVWESVGVPGFSSGEIYSTSLALSVAAVPYIAFADDANGMKATVMRFNGIIWEMVGSAGFSAGAVEEPSLAINGSGVPYVAFQDAANGYKATVMKFTGSGWEAVGAAGFSAGVVHVTSLSLSASGVPYVAYQDDGNGRKTTLMRFNGASWESVGVPGFSTTTADAPSLALNSQGMPYVAFMDGARGSKATVMRFNGSIWETVGTSGFSTGGAYYPSLAIDNNGVPYLAYQDLVLGKVVMMRFFAGAWETVGPPGISAGTAAYIDLAMNSLGVPFVVFQDGPNANKATVVKSSFEP